MPVKLPELGNGITPQGLQELEMALGQGATAEGLLSTLDEQMGQATALRNQTGAADNKNPWMGIGDVLSNFAGKREQDKLRPQQIKQRGLVAAAQGARDKEEQRRTGELEKFRRYGALQQDRAHERGVLEDDRDYGRQVGRDRIGDEQKDRARSQSEMKAEPYVSLTDPEDIINTSLRRVDGETVRWNDSADAPLDLDGYKPYKEWNPNSGAGGRSRGKAYTKKDNDSVIASITIQNKLEGLANDFDPTKAQFRGALPGETPNRIMRWLNESGTLGLMGKDELEAELTAASQFEGDLVKLVQAPERHELYGAQLTKSEQELFKRGDWLTAGNPHLGERLKHMALVKGKYLMYGLESEIIRQQGVPQDMETLIRHADAAGFEWDGGTKRLSRKDGRTDEEIDAMITSGYSPTGEGSGPEVGTVEGGYEYQGGDPKDPASWSPVQ